MVLWPALALIGFFVLTWVVILMGTHSTARYEQERLAAAERRTQRTSSDPLGATAVL
jgi:uncharacterized BrkB/YihY/UPF0761 family membrane protein